MNNTENDNPMALANFAKDELLEMLDVLFEWDCIDPTSLPENREEVTNAAEDFWRKCCKYRAPLIAYVYRHVNAKMGREDK